MELKLKPCAHNPYPAGGIFVKGSSPLHWLHEMQYMGLHTGNTRVFALPELHTGAIWGCILLPRDTEPPRDTGRNNLAYSLHRMLYVPGACEVFPAIQVSELEHILGFDQHVFHPETGLCPLDAPIEWESLLALPEALQPGISAPEDGIYIPAEIHSFRIKPLPAEELLHILEKQVFPPGEKLNDKPLSTGEKLKLHTLRRLFRKKEEKPADAGNKKTEDTSYSKERPSEATRLLEQLKRIGRMFSGRKSEEWGEKLQDDYEDLEHRNQAAIDRLLDMFRNNPEEALKYAIPIDQDGTSRGGNGQMELNRRWNDFSLGSLLRNQAGTGSSGSSIIPDQQLQSLEEQYRKTAEAFIQQKQYQKAAFIYMKLLRDHAAAAAALKQGGYYPEAAAVYLKYLNNKHMAAGCYEQGKMYEEAAALYKELNNDEKTGDMYMLLSKKEEAFQWYNKAVETFVQKKQPLHAAEFVRSKMQDEARAMQLLKWCWLQHIQARQGLLQYLGNINDPRIQKEQIEHTFRNELDAGNRIDFMYAVKPLYEQLPDMQERLREMAHEIIAAEAAHTPAVVDELAYFSRPDKMLEKDTMRFRDKNRKKQNDRDNNMEGMPGWWI